jgi:aminoglycoside phosphotransferase (APT) family kinase protein
MEEGGIPVSRMGVIDVVGRDAMVRLHPDEIESDESLARRLVDDHFPAWRDLPVRRVVPGGTDNAMYRLGDDLAIRLPRRPSAAGQIELEARWLPRLAPKLPLAIPEAVAVVAPSEAFPWPWAVVRWIDGGPVTADALRDPIRAACDLGAFVRALGRIDATDGPVPSRANSGRGVPLALRDESTRRNIEALYQSDCPGLLLEIWEASLAVPPWSGTPRWVHGDLLPVNIVARDGRVVAAIDWGCLSIGDPATDLMAGWTIFEGASRRAFREASGCDDDTWARGRGWAVSWAAICLPYYRPTGNPLVAIADRVLATVTSEWRDQGA